MRRRVSQCRRSLPFGLLKQEPPPCTLIKEIRRANFITIRTAHAAALVDLGALSSTRGSLRIFANKIGTSQAMASHLNVGYEAIGEQLARQIETAFGLDRGRMDNDHGTAETPASVGEFRLHGGAFGPRESGAFCAPPQHTHERYPLRRFVRC
jgi:hypothetical protein